MSIAVFGGNGFLGRKLCEFGIRNGYNVTSFARSSRPPVTGNQFLDRVTWESANIFDGESYKSKLGQFDIVFHSIGKLFEDASYKQNLNSKSIYFSNLKNIVLGSNPMSRTNFNSYKGLHKDSAIQLAQAYHEMKQGGKFVYVSAEYRAPVVPKEYLTSKREAEHELLKLDLDTLIVRPGIMYDSSNRDARYTIAQGLKLANSVKDSVLGQSSCAKRLEMPIYSVDETCAGIYRHLGESNRVLSLRELMH